MRKARGLVQTGRKAVQDLNLLKVLRSEIQHELSSDPYPTSKSSSLGDFVLEWDSPETQDVMLRRKLESGEEVALTAKLGDISPWADFNEAGLYPRHGQMKICVKKPRLSSLLQFDCDIWEDDHVGYGFTILDFYYLHSPAHIGPSVYRGPRPYYNLDSKLRGALKEYLVAKGIGEELVNFLLHYLHKKEQGQYVNWLQKLESFVTKAAKPDVIARQESSN